MNINKYLTEISPGQAGIRAGRLESSMRSKAKRMAKSIADDTRENILITAMNDDDFDDNDDYDWYADVILAEVIELLKRGK